MEEVSFFNLKASITLNIPAATNDNAVHIIIFNTPNAGTASTMNPRKQISIPIASNKPQLADLCDRISKANPTAENPLNNNQNPRIKGSTAMEMPGYASKYTPMAISNMPPTSVQPHPARDFLAVSAKMDSKIPVTTILAANNTLKVT